MATNLTKISSLFSIICLFTIQVSMAQCPFDPTIIPNNITLCPNSHDTIWTQSYDSYQWYKNNVLIPGATNQFYVVDYATDGGSSFSILATDAGCSELSPPVFVDGWVFLLPAVQHDGDLGWFDGQYLHLCVGDTLILILLQPYDTLIQWYDGFSPIAGATDDTLYVTTTGNYTVEGAPSICPNFIQQLGVTISVIFHQPVTPVINQSNDTLYASPQTALGFQWFLNAFPIPGASNYWHVPTVAGSYTVSRVDSNQCEKFSDPFIVVGIQELVSSKAIKIFPNPFTNIFEIHVPNSFIEHINIYHVTGQLVYQHQLTTRTTNYNANLEHLPPGMYFVEVISAKEDYSIKIVKE